jgi:hypothetical protein
MLSTVVGVCLDSAISDFRISLTDTDEKIDSQFLGLPIHVDRVGPFRRRQPTHPTPSHNLETQKVSKKCLVVSEKCSKFCETFD